MSNYSDDPVRAIAGRLVKGMRAFQTVSMTDFVRIWRAHPATTGAPSEAECYAIEECLKSFDGGKDGGGYALFPSLAECPADESFRIYRENTAYDNVRRMFTHPNRLDDVHIVEIVERWKGKWEWRPASEPGSVA